MTISNISRSTSITATGVELTTPSITVVDMATAGTEYSLALPANTLRFELSLRLKGPFKMAFASGDIALGDYRTIIGNYYETKKASSSVTVYFTALRDNQKMEILHWT